MKKGKQAYYNKYFETNWNNIKNTWRAVKSLIYLKTAVSRAPTVLSLDIVKLQLIPMILLTRGSIYKNNNIHINIFQAMLRMSAVVQYFLKLLK